MRYIDADKFERECMFDKNCNDMQDVIYKLRDYPTADVVEVVRCKDCKYYSKGIIQCYMHDIDVHGDDFCSYGERVDT